ncbi:uncharacterized protein Fot_38490 [Forsythia ovata]|uniref:Uncharacterized protein n=1 Tax=Forsythia ovata TaxID=205694 RepID=A0ABD1S1Y4_9LAMI
MALTPSVSTAKQLTAFSPPFNLHPTHPTPKQSLAPALVHSFSSNIARSNESQPISLFRRSHHCRPTHHATHRQPVLQSPSLSHRCCPTITLSTVKCLLSRHCPQLFFFAALKDWVKQIDIQKFDILLCIGNKVDLLPRHPAHAEYRKCLLKREKSCGSSRSDLADHGISETE